MRAGTLRCGITLQRQDNAPRNDYGERPPVWSDLGSVRGGVEAIRGQERMGASGENASLTHRIRVRYTPLIESLRPRDRVLYRDRIFDLQAIVPNSDGKQAELMAIERIRD